MEILNLFGVDWKLMLAQLINFLVVLAVLWWFAIKPLMKTMGSRSQEISKGLSDAKQATQRLEEVEKEIKAKLQTTKMEAAKILEQAKKQADGAKQVSLEKTKQEINTLITKAKEQISSEKNTMLIEAKKELGQVVVEAVNKILSEGLSHDLDKKYINETLKHIK